MTHVNYFDLGLGPQAEEVKIMVYDVLPRIPNITYTVYGIEAHPDYVKSIQLAYQSHNYVKIFNLAISNEKGTRKLYLASNQLGNSIFSTKDNVNVDNFHEVESNTFSGWLKENNIDLTKSINILKVNIEGAELYLYEDMKQMDLRKYFHVICGHLSHDINKVKELELYQDRYFNLLKELDINMVRFCGEVRAQSNVDMVKIINEVISKQ